MSLAMVGEGDGVFVFSDQTMGEARGVIRGVLPPVPLFFHHRTD